MELSSKRSVAIDHLLHVVDCKVMRVLLRRIVPSNVVKVTVYCGVAELFRVAHYSVEVSFGRRYEVRVVHEYCSGEVLVSPYAVVDEGSR